MCLKCNSCKQALSLSIDRANLEIHLICDLCNTSDNHTLSATQIASIEQCDPATRLRKVECFITLNNYKSKMGGEKPVACFHETLYRVGGTGLIWKCSQCTLLVTK